MGKFNTKKRKKPTEANDYGEWDYENASLPNGFNVALIKPAITQFLLAKGYYGDLSLTMVVSDASDSRKIHRDTYRALYYIISLIYSWRNSLLVYQADDISVFHIGLNCFLYVSGGGQVSDVDIYREIHTWNLVI
ncbi:hypothetical protein ARALYDRAFT_915941 [Arabidopsis lyrata subsp. lyrata]|uniref:Uncharacterized protein n=1 Tax=Arabidopsis lyrata subsp. lyrata TaxID=81972 RepID=D7MII8_ARALL|nr:uncharacterized protein LOC9306642 [Arabidopsis lyrata subsp. lyrata]EFH46830.1 hypothetical protein ARALYDRAFT_915941 [Arabidopsis lyrata subsp. lyrata]|eukprot:XP_002870571.1 uncharacterized protein LOC9306642 [Arabidopsis lyrata subsp. lyrata]